MLGRRRGKTLSTEENQNINERHAKSVSCIEVPSINFYKCCDEIEEKPNISLFLEGNVLINAVARKASKYLDETVSTQKRTISPAFW